VEERDPDTKNKYQLTNKPQMDSDTDSAMTIIWRDPLNFFRPKPLFSSEI